MSVTEDIKNEEVDARDDGTDNGNLRLNNREIKT